MNMSLKYVSISHETASAMQRGVFHVSDDEKSVLVNSIRDKYKDIAGLLILSTCNRTEFYFESSLSTAATIRDFYIKYKGENIKTNRSLFKQSNNSKNTARHLLEVSSGLKSLVLGDAEIIHQVKKAYQFSMAYNMQGSLLERALQMAFKSHKRISNETNFRDGTTSVTYKTLNYIRNFYHNPKTKKILLIGAGDIIHQLLKYNSKFNFLNLYISNRTEEKAIALGTNYNCKLYSWKKVISNDFEDFDVVISAANNCHCLIKKTQNPSKESLLIDLAMPSNIDHTLSNNKNIKLLDLETISNELKNTKEKRLAAVNVVNTIINEELITFNNWLNNAALRMSLYKYKLRVLNQVKAYFKSKSSTNNSESIEMITNQIMKKFLAANNSEKSLTSLNKIISKEIAF